MPLTIEATLTEARDSLRRLVKLGYTAHGIRHLLHERIDTDCDLHSFAESVERDGYIAGYLQAALDMHAIGE
jgi:hypothetical protein